MKIDPARKPPVSEVNATRSPHTGDGLLKPGATPVSARDDWAEVSRAGLAASRVDQETPPERIEALRRQVTEGVYQVDSGTLSRKIVSSLLDS